MAGRIQVDGRLRSKPGDSIGTDSHIDRVGDPPRFVSRAGYKLEAALEHFRIDVAGRVALDIGSSTGGFTDCLLQRGALRVHAIDAGTHQMSERLRHDSRVLLRENTNARYLTPDVLGERATVLTVDVSFISVRLLLPALVGLLEPCADAVILVKPQFEAGRDAVERGGLVRDPRIRIATVDAVAAAAGGHQLRMLESWPSPVLGATGNQEYLMYARFLPTAV